MRASGRYNRVFCHASGIPYVPEYLALSYRASQDRARGVSQEILYLRMCDRLATGQFLQIGSSNAAHTPDAVPVMCSDLGREVVARIVGYREADE